MNVSVSWSSMASIVDARSIHGMIRADVYQSRDVLDDMLNAVAIHDAASAPATQPAPKLIER
jgi:hypothetical protein